MTYEIKNGGVGFIVPYEVAKDYAIRYVNTEMQNTCGLNKEAKVMLAFMKEIVQLNKIIEDLRK